MCEWLSHGEWCDVKLLCGGRSFNAHRAVLASVSNFLRGILLACPIDETPTFIVLPDFDLEAMSSVLYYIYNGEVVVPKQKLGFFLDIIQAMQIFIDCQYLPNIKETLEVRNFDLDLSYDVVKQKREVFTLAFGITKDQKFFNIRRGTELQSVLLQYSQNETDCQDNIGRCQNGSELRRSRLGNLKSPYEDRQRNSFLRDLFIETYPRNGNVNGLTEGVLAISNECYRSPASVLSTNANGKHLADDSLSSFCTKITQQSLHMPTLLHSEQQLQCTKEYSGKCRSSGPPCMKYLTDTRDATMLYSNSKSIVNLPKNGAPLLPHQLKHKNLSSEVNASSLNIRQSILETMKCHFMKDSIMKNAHLESEREEKKIDLKSNICSKVIFNQVLESPWSPRKHIDYRPFRRKEGYFETEKHQSDKVGVMSDNNNNIQTTTLTEDEEHSTERVSFETVKPMDSSSAITISRDSFKCTHCNQVFTSSESLAVHMRRHSTNARYTCGECGKTFSQLRNFKYHMSIHRGTREFAATCSVCGKYFNDRGYLSSHMKIHRNRKEYKCNLCPKSFNQRVAYNMHVRIHTGVKPHVCEQCGKAFSRKMLLKQHQRTHSGERPYACPHCDKRFADRSNMTLHLRLHTGVKPFSCSMCPKSFTKKHHLKSHLNFHTGSKPYSCPRCKLAFTQSSNMRTHLKKCSAPGLGSSNDAQTHI